MEEVELIKETLALSKGRTPVSIDVQTVRGVWPMTMNDSDGDRRIVWDWFNEYFGDDEYDVVCFHFTDYWKKKWNLSARINGSFNLHNTDQFQFWFAADRGEQAKNYDFLESTRLILHEMAHGDSIRLGTPNVIHYFDYKLHSLSAFFETVDYRMYNLKKRLAELLKQLYAKIADVQAN